MPLDPGSSLGQYEVAAPLGAGGMGEVYRARDTILGREVAIKVLPDGFAEDDLRAARFEREAKALASLNHPNVATLHGFERQGSVQYLVMELVEGQDLSERLAGGPLSVSDAIALFSQIADGLEAAHERGIVHRDLKPGNVKITRDGRLKILDFGLAKAVGPGIEPGSEGDASRSPTLSLAATVHGQILGTASYMAPEQARGLSVDRRADIWAFGCCLYEALTGRRPFGGRDVSETLASVLKSEPDWSAIEHQPASLRRLLRRCLEKEPAQRLRDIADARLELREAQGEPPEDQPTIRVTTTKAGMGWLALPATALVTALITFLSVRWFESPNERTLVRSVLSAPPAEPVSMSTVDIDVAISRDGKSVVYQTAGGLYLRRLDELEGKLLAGTEDSSDPFLSPDGAWVGFVEGTALMKVKLSGGTPVRVCEAPATPSNAFWSKDGTIFFGVVGSGLYRVAAAGGEPEVLLKARPELGEEMILWPHRLPRGNALLYVVLSPRTRVGSRLEALDLETGARTSLIEGGGRAIFASSGHLLYMASDGLRAIGFDPDTLELRGEPSLVPEVVTRDSGGGDFDVADDGSLVYAAGDVVEENERILVWVNREGHEEPVGAPSGFYVDPSISPEGNWLAVTDAAEGYDVWLHDLRRGARSRLTRGAEREYDALWMPDARHIVYSSGAIIASEIRRQRADGIGEPEIISSAAGRINTPTSVSPDGRWLIYDDRVVGTPSDIGSIDLESGRAGTLLAASEADERGGRLSPDGRLLAYESNETGRFEIYLRPFPEVDARRWGPISISGGVNPRWSADGRELFYSDAGRLLAVPLETEPEVVVGTPRELFASDYVGGYDVHPDGKRFLMVKPAREVRAVELAPQIVLVQGFLAELSRGLAPSG